MIPEPPDGTKLVVITSTDEDFVVYRDDQDRARKKVGWRSKPNSHWYWDCADNFWTRSTWEEVQAMGTLHLIGPELGQEA